MSKQSRRVRPGSRPVGQPAAPAAAGGTTRDPAESRPTGASTRPVSPRAGRRERARPAPQPSLLERYRAPIVGVVVVAAIALMAVFAFSSSRAGAYSCSVQFQGPPAASPAPGSSTPPGYVQDDMGNTHVDPGSDVTYTFCPPATGSHYDIGAPIAPRVYGPGDRAIPQGWIHNLEHGGLVILYRGEEGDEGITDAGQQSLTTFYNDLPNSPVCGFPANQQGAGLVIARFDEMATPYAALVWGRILPLDTLDTASIMAFWNAYGERTNPEKFCAVPSGNPATSPTAS